MKPSAELRRREVLLAALALLGGCGGVDSGGTGTGASSTYASGPITGFGSIIVNGVRFDESGASILDDDERLRLSDELRLGMRTEIVASAVTTVAGISSATASTIRLRREILGPLEAVDAPNARLLVFGQTVGVVATTVFDNTLANGMASLLPGDVLEIYATLDIAAGLYVASRIERRASAEAYKLRGAVAALTFAAQTLTLGRLTIDWSAAAPTDPDKALAPGRLLRLTLATTPVAGVWRATALASGEPMPDDREFAEVEGRITAFTSPTDFALDGLPVDATDATFPDGRAGLARGAKVEVHGSLRRGVLVASRVELEDEEGGPEAFELHGSISSVDAAASRFVVRGLTVVWSATTRFESGTPADDIKIDRRVEVKGRLSADGLLIEATSVHFEL
ncbi:MAG: DUF5666 domain-containing protein [Burkholderiaceae bacterium]|nr:DUF5666 domain-containing protein [Burkholderiaceae bacterium]